MVSTGVHALPAELARVADLAGRLATTKSRIVRAALALACIVDVAEVRYAVERLKALEGACRQSGIHLPVDELTDLDRIAGVLAVPRSRLVRAAVVLFLRVDSDRQRGLVDGLPVAGRLLR